MANETDPLNNPSRQLRNDALKAYSQQYGTPDVVSQAGGYANWINQAARSPEFRTFERTFTAAPPQQQGGTGAASAGGGSTPAPTSGATGGGTVYSNNNSSGIQYVAGMGAARNKPTGIIASQTSSVLTPEQVQQYNPFGDLTPQLNNQVNAATETVEGRIESLLSGDNELMQRARAIAAGEANRRGLVNSSMGVEAGTAAMIDRALPIASQDAQIYSDRAMFNAGETNKLVAQGADIASRFGLQSNEFKFQSTENAADRASNEKLTTMKIQSDAALSKAQMAHDAALTNLKIAADAANTDKSIAAQQKLQEAQYQFQGAQAELDRLQQTNLQLQQQMFQSTENEADRQAQINFLALQQAFTGKENELDRENQRQLLQLQTSLNNANIPKGMAAEIASNLARDVSSIASSPDMKADAKAVQIRNLYDAANAAIQTISSLYDTPLVGVGDAGVVQPGGTTAPETPTTPGGGTTPVVTSPRIP